MPIGVGIPVGAMYQHEEVAIEAYFEGAPVFQIAPTMEYGISNGRRYSIVSFFLVAIKKPFRNRRLMFTRKRD